MRYASTIALTVFGLVFATVFAVPVSVDVSPADETFTFAVAGDIGWNETGAKSTHFHWVLGAVDSARAAGIRWVIVSIPKPCIRLVGTSCPSGQDLLDALLIKKVDLILPGDQHSYQRTKQLRCAIRSAGFYFPECIADSDGQFAKGAGSVIAIVGTGGRGFSSVGLTTDADRQYFATAMGSNTPGYGWGYLRVTITATQLTARTAFSGTWQDSFSIGG